MFKYQDGSDILVRDNVLIEGGKTPAVIGFIITTVEGAKDINVDKVGVMMKSAPFGMVNFTKPWLKKTL